MSTVWQIWKPLFWFGMEKKYCSFFMNFVTDTGIATNRFLLQLTAFLLKLWGYCGDNKTCFIQAENVTPLKYFPKLHVTKLLYFLTGFYLWNKERFGNKTMWEGRRKNLKDLLGLKFQWESVTTTVSTGNFLRANLSFKFYFTLILLDAHCAIADWAIILTGK